MHLLSHPYIYYTIHLPRGQLIEDIFHQTNTHNIVHLSKGDIDMVDFGNTLKTLRLRENMTQAQLAQKLGLTKSVISAYETGLRLPSYDVLIHVSKIFKVSTDYLLGVESQHDLDLSGISDDEVIALKNLIKVMRNRH